MWKFLFVAITFSIFFVGNTNQSEKIKIDWNNIWHFVVSDNSPKQVKLARLPREMLHIRQPRIIGGRIVP
jgi:hypothetical protein